MSTPWRRVRFRLRGSLSPAAWLPVQLSAFHSVRVVGLIDTGAAISVFPYRIGVRLGFDWKKESVPITLGGSLTGIPGKVVTADVTVVPFPPKQLLFAWSRSNSHPVLLGRLNFFDEFDVLFTGSRGEFRIRPKS